MSLSQLGYTEKWITYNFLSKADYKRQVNQLRTGKDKIAAPFRLETLVNWVEAQQEIAHDDILHFLEIIEEESDEFVAGKALTALYTSPALSEGQFETLSAKLPEFGDWTEKLITREVLSRALDEDTITVEHYDACLAYKNEFSDNRLLVKLIKKTDSMTILEAFEHNGCGKKLRTIATKRINQLNR